MDRNSYRTNTTYTYALYCNNTNDNMSIYNTLTVYSVNGTYVFKRTQRKKNKFLKLSITGALVIMTCQASNSSYQPCRLGNKHPIAHIGHAGWGTGAEPGLSYNSLSQNHQTCMTD
jgi:hypothetical protein